MTVNELIKALERVKDKDAPVAFGLPLAGGTEYKWVGRVSEERKSGSVVLKQKAG